MPKVHKGETEEEFKGHAIKMMMLEGRPRKQAIAIAMDMWREHMKKK